MSDGFKKSALFVGLGTVGSALVAVIPADSIRVGTLTLITQHMSTEIIKSYGYETLEGPANFSSVAIGAFTGVTLANAILTKFPGLGSVAASASTASLHLLTGAAIISICEMLKSGELTDQDLQDNAVCKALCNTWLKAPGDFVIKRLRGTNPVELAYGVVTGKP